MKVYLSPSGQYANTYAAGDTTEKEQCERIAAACKAALERSNVRVILEPEVAFYDRIRHANEQRVDLYIPIHTNAFDGKVSGTRMFYYSLLSKGYKAVKAIFPYLDAVCPGTSSNIKSNPQLIELRDVNAPAAYCECDFHDVPEVAQFIISHTTEIGEAIAHGACDFLGEEYAPPQKTETRYRVQVGSFASRAYADDLVRALNADGYDAFIVEIEAIR